MHKIVWGAGYTESIIISFPLYDLEESALHHRGRAGIEAFSKLGKDHINNNPLEPVHTTFAAYEIMPLRKLELQCIQYNNLNSK